MLTLDGEWLLCAVVARSTSGLRPVQIAANRFSKSGGGGSPVCLHLLSVNGICSAELAGSKYSKVQLKLH